MPMFEISKEFRFEAAHRLSKHAGKCANIHGHNYRVVITLKNSELPPNGMVYDFGLVSRSIGDDIKKFWDHSLLLIHSDYEKLRAIIQSLYPGQKFLVFDQDPTAEVIAERIYRNAAAAYSYGVLISRVRVHETDSAWAEFVP